ncbi:MAG TPA: ATP-binding protein [Candidatus Acidoferrum sp.]|nr:ATP-binding protein [Candidatus Acidoferrum sp.]
MTIEELQEQLARTEATVHSLQQELAQTDRGLLALTADMQQRLDERAAQLSAANAALELSKARLVTTEATVRALQQELAETNRGLVALTLELQQRVDQRTSELRHLNQQLEDSVAQRTAQLREVNANLQHFAHTAAHDLRAPLRSIKNLSEAVLEDNAAQLSPDAQVFLRRVSESATHMHKLLDDLLEYSTLGGKDVRLRPISLNDTLREALGFLESEIRTHQAEVTIQEPLPQVLGHWASLVLLMTNLLSNALKFTPPGARPRVRIWAEDGSGPDRVRFCIEDSGIGIAAKDTEHIFQAFHRVHGRHKYPGTGLGLAIVRRSAERMGGRVSVESEPGHGSRFWVDLQAPPQNARAE